MAYLEAIDQEVLERVRALQNRDELEARQALRARGNRRAPAPQIQEEKSEFEPCNMDDPTQF